MHLSAMYLAQYWACHVNHRLWRGSQGSMSHAELRLTHRFWARGSYCLQLCTHWGTHELQTYSSIMVIQMVKINGSQQTKQHKQTNKKNLYEYGKGTCLGLGNGKEIKEGRQWLKLNRIYYLYANCQRTNLIKSHWKFFLVLNHLYIPELYLIWSWYLHFIIYFWYYKIQYSNMLVFCWGFVHIYW